MTVATQPLRIGPFPRPLIFEHRAALGGFCLSAAARGDDYTIIRIDATPDQPATVQVVITTGETR